MLIPDLDDVAVGDGVGKLEHVGSCRQNLAGDSIASLKVTMVLLSQVSALVAITHVAQSTTAQIETLIARTIRIATNPPG